MSKKSPKAKGEQVEAKAPPVLATGGEIDGKHHPPSCTPIAAPPSTQRIHAVLAMRTQNICVYKAQHDHSTVLHAVNLCGT